MQFQIYTEEDKKKLYEFLTVTPYPFKVRLDGIYKDRSISQNRYYHLIKKQLADHLGLTPRECHNMLLREFALIEEIQVDGEWKDKVESTTGMTTLRMEEFLENIRRWALTIHGLYLPLPNEIIDEELKFKII